MSSHQYDLLIIGAGVSGTALLYLASRYTDLEHIGIIDKYAAPARVNSLSSNNSQTLHCGDIETNYTLDKALKVQPAANMLKNYAVRQADSHHIIFKYPKLVLASVKTNVAVIPPENKRAYPLGIVFVYIYQ